MLRLGFNQENHLGQGYKKIMLWLKITILLAANEARDVLRSHLKQLFFVVRKPGDALTCLFFKFFFFFVAKTCLEMSGKAFHKML